MTHEPSWAEIAICMSILLTLSIISIKYRDWTKSKCQRGVVRHKGKCDRYVAIDKSGVCTECTLCEKCVKDLENEGYEVHRLIKTVTTKSSI